MINAIILPIIILIAILVILIVLSAKFKAFGKAMGFIFLIAGVAAVVYGIVRTSSFESQFASFFGASDDTAMACFVLGGIGIVFGIILLAIGFSGGRAHVYNYQAPPVNNMTVNVVKVRCPNCQALNDEGARFCKICGNPLVSQKQQM